MLLWSTDLRLFLSLTEAVNIQVKVVCCVRFVHMLCHIYKEGHCMHAQFTCSAVVNVWPP